MLEQILQMIKHLTWLMKELPEDDMILRLLDELLGVYKEVSARRYIAARGTSAGRHEGPGEISILENLIKNYPETAFLNLFRMHRSSFWILVDIITPMWPTEPATKNPARPIYQQLAVALYILGSTGGGGLERSRIALNISKGAIAAYVWRSLEIISQSRGVV